MSSRDLPLWARGGTAALLIVGGWFSARSAPLAGLLGESVVEISAGVIAFSILLGMRLPVDLWPQAASRARFSIPVTLLASVILGSLVVLARSTGIPGLFWESERAALGVVVLGGAALAVGWGRTRQLPYARWYGVAVLCAVMPVALGMFGLAVRGEVHGLDVTVFVRSFGFFVFFATAGALVTQEVAFRRLLVGQSGDAGLLMVLLAAFVFGVWHAVIPSDGPMFATVAIATLNGIVLGSLYILSRSLLIPALFHGLQNGMVKSYYAAVAAETGEVLVAGSLWIPMLLVTILTSFILAFGVSRRTGFFGTLFAPPRTRALAEPTPPVASARQPSNTEEQRDPGATDHLSLTDDPDN